MCDLINLIQNDCLERNKTKLDTPLPQSSSNGYKNKCRIDRMNRKKRQEDIEQAQNLCIAVYVMQCNTISNMILKFFGKRSNPRLLGPPINFC